MLIRAAMVRALPNAKSIVASIPEELNSLFTSEKAVKPSSRAKVIKWAQASIKTDPAFVESALNKTYADFTILGTTAAQNALGMEVVTNWNTWKPGNSAAAALLEPKGSLAKLLKQADVVAKGVLSTKTDRIGSIIAEGLANGDSGDTIARALREVIDNPRQALAIANTEGARATVLAARDEYRDAGVELFEWITADPCDECENNEVESEGGVPFGFTFNSGVQYPPAHPECRCDIVPVIP